MLTRRILLASAAPIALAGCGAQNNQVNVPALAQKVKIVVDGLAAEMPAIAALGAPLGVTPSVLDLIQSAISQAQTASQALLAASTAAEGQSAAQKVQTYLNAFLAAVVALPLPPQIKSKVDAAAALVPILEVVFNLAVVK